MMKKDQTNAGTTHEPLQEKIKRIVREELKLMMNEAVNPVFNKFSGADEAGLKAWILRQWFSPEKSKDKPWYSDKVNSNNVLDYVSTNRAFPVTPVQIATMWRDKKSLKSLLPKAEKEMDQAQSEDDVERAQYNKNSETILSDVAKELGVTHQATAYIEQDGFEKFRQLFGGDPNNIDPEQLDSLNSRIEAAREKASTRFGEALKSSGGDMSKLQGELHKLGLLPAGHSFSKEEREALQYVAKQYTPEQIKELLLADIEEDDNLFKSFQMAVARTVFPDKRRKAVD